MTSVLAGRRTCESIWTPGPGPCEGDVMAPPRYTAYDRTLDFLSDHRMAIAKGFVLLAVLAIFASLLATLLI